ncbi:MAG: bifunctional phosphoribosyl-AMP cyclohydrolase/phosphoribosyl-ATP diphosphatase HisIE [Lachnospiraceae bacterium]|nr:bifunctional phosphoribosyl-AMP cyclohydrolase/phosphoribosyl-ATP diphosphatase HisIE [Lachnospiraceae bacterium]
MGYFKLVPCIHLRNGEAVNNNKTDAVALCESLCDNGADELYIIDESDSDKEHDINIGIMKQIASAVDIPMLIGGNIKRLEDVKKYLYAGGAMAVLDMSKDSNTALIKAASDRFGTEKIAVYAENADIADYSWKENGASLIITSKYADTTILPVLTLNNIDDSKNTLEFARDTGAYGVAQNVADSVDIDFLQIKESLKTSGVNVNTFESSMKFSDFKLNSDGHLPVVVQDYKTNEVLMMAYMNEEAFNTTIKTGRMTYYSRSRKELWVKGLTSGHFQYVKSLTIDCDNDTLLAKVKQIGAACHTGNRTCFFNTLVKKEYDDTNPLEVFNDVFNVILDRKANPKEGSYTNYLFDKGIDKILKKVGEEAAEILIAAKNPDPEEVIYEISDFIYHAMVLMAEKGISWEEITRELARR